MLGVPHRAEKRLQWKAQRCANTLGRDPSLYREMKQSYRPLPPVDYLRRFFRYCQDSGQLLRYAKLDPWHNYLLLAKERAMGRTDNWGYLRMDIGADRNILVHRVIWKIVTCEDPGRRTIDHIDGNKLNNKIDNLRLADLAENCWNKPAQKMKDGEPVLIPYKGVTYVRDRNGELAYIIARISFRGKRIYLGTFNTPEQAARAYAKASMTLHHEYANGAAIEQAIEKTLEAVK